MWKGKTGVGQGELDRGSESTMVRAVYKPYLKINKFRTTHEHLYTFTIGVGPAHISNRADFLRAYSIFL